MSHPDFIITNTGNKDLELLFDNANWSKLWFDDLLIAFKDSNLLSNPTTLYTISGNKLFLFSGRLDKITLLNEFNETNLFRNRSDSELVAAAYDLWQDKALDYLSGNFFIITYDKKDKIIKGFTSPLTCPKIYYTTSDKKDFFIANNLPFIFSALQGIPEYNESFFTEYWGLFGANHSSQTPFNNINRLESGCEITHKNQNVRINKYYSLPKEIKKRNFSNDLEEEFRQHLFTAVENSIDSHEKIFIDLSGGLDSSTLVCIAAELCKKGKLDFQNFETISYGYSQSKSCRENEYWKEVVQSTPFKNWEYDFDSKPMFSQPPQYISPEPSLQINNVALNNLLEEFIPALGGNVLLRGIGGDEVISGYSGFPLHLSHYLKSGNLMKWFYEFLDWHRERREFTYKDLLWNYTLLPLFNPSSVVFTDCFDLPNWLSAKYVKEQLSPFISDWQRNFNQTYSTGNKLHSGIILNCESYHLQNSGIEGRYPLLNKQFTEFMLQLDWKDKISPEFDRLIQRRALKGILPEKIRTRIRKTFTDEYILRGIKAGWIWLSDVLKNSQIIKRGYVDKDSFNNRLTKILHGKCDSDIRFVALALNLEIWFQAIESAKSNKTFRGDGFSTFKKPKEAQKEATIGSFRTSRK